jgi:branched-chain amino acid transport system ATP-binding protein
MAILVAENVSKRFGGINALNDVSICVEPGQILGIIGPNGSGKTTFFNVVTGIYGPDRGCVSFADRDITGKRPYQITSLGIARTFQNIRLFANLSVLENVLVGEHIGFHSSVPAVLYRNPSQRLEEREAREKALDLLRWVGLNVDVRQPARALPYGYQRRVEIARALASEPRILLLDEPTAGMSQVECQETMALVRQIRDRNVTVVLVEHNMRVMMGLADWIVVLDGGRRIAQGEPPQIQRDRSVIEAYLGEA